MNQDNEEYDYEYDVDEHNSESNDCYGLDTINFKSTTMKTFDDNWINAKTGWQPSTIVYDSPYMNRLIERLNDFNQIFFKSWSSLFNKQEDGSGGTILRFQNTKDSRKKSNDFDLTMMKNGFSINLKPNMDYLREEVQADIATFDYHKLDGVTFYTASSKNEEDGCIQMLLIKVGKSDYTGYLSLCDQLFIPMRNKFLVNEQAAKPSLDWQQAFAVDQLMSIQDVVAYQRRSKMQ